MNLEAWAPAEGCLLAASITLYLPLALPASSLPPCVDSPGCPLALAPGASGAVQRGELWFSRSSVRASRQTLSRPVPHGGACILQGVG